MAAVVVQDVELKHGKLGDLDCISKFPFWGLSTYCMNISLSYHSYVLCH